MQLESLHAYQEPIALADGVEVQLRPMTPADFDALLALFSTATDEDVRYLRHDVRNPAVVQRWCDNLDYQRVLPLTALAHDRMVGQATLHFGSGPERHVARVRIFVAEDFRRRGLGTGMLKALIELARECGMHALLAEIVSIQTGLIRAFLKLGFELCFTLQDHFMLPNGSTRGVTILRLCLQPPCDDL